VLDVVCWKWKPMPGYRSHFNAKSVNVLRNMVARNLQMIHRFTCITDDPTGIDPDIRIIPLWDTYANIPSPSGPRNPSCYRRLKMFAPEAKELIGERIVSMDLDTVVTGDLTPLFDRQDDFIIWGGQSAQPAARGRPWCWYNGSFMMLRAGAREQVWSRFNPVTSPREAHAANARGSDQGWITHCLGTGEKVWTERDGIYSFRNHVLPGKGRLPPGARLIAFHGAHDPWKSETVALAPWIQEYYF